ncbi:MAG: hypothetical protein PHQ28_00420 [Mycobacterium sp.]|nr:hypothetical protein [Mycobacterium sp.]
MRLAVWLLPVYVIAMIAVAALTRSVTFEAKPDVPWWIPVILTIVAVAAFLAAATYSDRGSRRHLTVQRDRAWIAFIIVLSVSEFIDSGLKALVGRTLHSTSIWIAIPTNIASYAILLILLASITQAWSAKPGTGDSSPRR